MAPPSTLPFNQGADRGGLLVDQLAEARLPLDDDRRMWSESVGGDVRERPSAKFRQNVARFRLYRLRFLQQNMRLTAFFNIYQILKLKFLKFDKILQILRHLRNFR